MLKALVVGLIGLFIAGSAYAGCAGHTAASDSQQTVMTDKAKPSGQGG